MTRAAAVTISLNDPVLNRSKEHDITPTHRFAGFVLDIIAFVEEKIGEALEDETWRIAAVGEAAGAGAAQPAEHAARDLAGPGGGSRSCARSWRTAARLIRFLSATDPDMNVDLVDKSEQAKTRTP
jgi:hypothetical protein